MCFISKLTEKLTCAAHASLDGIIRSFLALLFLNVLFAILAAVLIIVEVIYIKLTVKKVSDHGDCISHA